MNVHLIKKVFFSAIAANASYIVSEDKHFDILKGILFSEVHVLKAKELQEYLHQSN
jgi:hypothetical protein